MQRVPLNPDSVDPGQVNTAVQAIAAGQMVILPTETVYGLVADPRQPAQVEALNQLKGRDKNQPFTYHLADPEDLQQYAAPLPARLQRLLTRFWPGPLTAVLPSKTDESDNIGLRVPAHPFTQAVIRQLGHPLFMTSPNLSGEQPVLQPADIAKQFPTADFLFDAGPPSLGLASTLMLWNGSEIRVLREGILTATEVLITAAAKLLFVCTGNTCRSPMAQALAQQLLAQALQVPADELLARGLYVSSAGAHAFAGSPASEGAIAAMQQMGIDLGHHLSQGLTPGLVQQADRIYCLSRSHLQTVLAMDPGASHKARLLNPNGDDVMDPFGADLQTYSQTRDQIASLIGAQLDDMLGLL